MNENIQESKVDILQKTEQALAELSIAGSAVTPQLLKVERLAERLRESDMTVAVIGQFKRGKSRLSNLILGEDVLPVGIVPITSAVTKVKYGEEAAEVRFLNGEIRKVTAEELETYISEQKNRANCRGVREVVLHTPAEFLKSGITFVDTPGVGSFHVNNTETAYEYMKESDAVIFLLSVDSPINQIEIDFLTKARAYAGKTYFAVNKTDLVSPEDLEAYVTYCEEILGEILGPSEQSTGNWLAATAPATGEVTAAAPAPAPAIRIFPVSAVTGAGVEELKATITEDLKTSLKDILHESARRKLADLLGEALKQLYFYRGVLNQPYEDLDEHFREMDAYLSELQEKAGQVKGAYEFRLNEAKTAVAEKIEAAFGMGFVLPIEEREALQLKMSREEYLEQIEALVSGVRETLTTILLYREENAFTVVRRMEDIYKVTRHLRSIKNTIERAQDLV